MNDKPIEVASTGIAVTHNTYGHAFSAPFTDTPNILTSLSTYNGTSQSGVAIDEINANRVKLHIDNLDDDTHVAENVNVFALQGTGLLFTETMAIVGETGVVTVEDTGKDNPFTINFSKSYNNPVVFVQAVGKDKDIYDAAVRLNFVAPMMLEAYLHSDNESVVPKALASLTFITKFLKLAVGISLLSITVMKLLLATMQVYSQSTQLKVTLKLQIKHN